MANSLWPHEWQHARPPCSSSTPGVHSNSCPSSHWCHSAISSSVIPFSSCPHSLPASESFPMNQLFAWGGQSIGVSALASVLPVNTEDWFPLEWAGWIVWKPKRPRSQSSLEKEEWSWRNQPSWLQIILQSYSHQDSMVLAQKQTYKPMEKDRKLRNKLMHLWAPYFWQRRQEYTMGQRQPLQQMVVGKWDGYM